MEIIKKMNGRGYSMDNEVLEYKAQQVMEQLSDDIQLLIDNDKGDDEK